MDRESVQAGGRLSASVSDSHMCADSALRASPRSSSQDMNEPASFVQGSVEGCPDSELENPPYTPSKSAAFVWWRFFKKRPPNDFNGTPKRSYLNAKRVFPRRQDSLLPLRSRWGPVELWDTVYVGPTEAVHPLQPAQHVRTDRGLRHPQVRASPTVCLTGVKQLLICLSSPALS